MNHVRHTNEACLKGDGRHLDGCLFQPPRVWMSHATHVNESCHTEYVLHLNRCPLYLCVCRTGMVCSRMLPCVFVCLCVFLCVAVCCRVLLCIAMCHCASRVLPCVAVCCRVLPCVAVCGRAHYNKVPNWFTRILTWHESSCMIYDSGTCVK